MPLVSLWSRQIKTRTYWKFIIIIIIIIIIITIILCCCCCCFFFLDLKSACPLDKWNELNFFALHSVSNLQGLFISYKVSKQV